MLLLPQNSSWNLCGKGKYQSMDSIKVEIKKGKLKKKKNEEVPDERHK